MPTQVIAQRYVILQRVAQGGMSAVYKAQDKRLQGKVVAIKEMSETAISPSERKEVLESFAREAQLLAQLKHPNLARVTDQFQDGERHYMVLEFVQGQTLEHRLEQQPDGFSEERVLAWADQLCDLLAYLHNQSPPIIYRDIKPSNIMIVDDTETVKLIDFGIARFFKPGKAKDTIQFGTEGYAPPEQYGKAQTDVRADVYALGATLHQLLTGYDPETKPFSFPPMRQLKSSVSKRVESAISKAVELNKDKRHQSMAEMWEALSGEAPQWFHLSEPASGPDLHIPSNPSPVPSVSPIPGIIPVPHSGTAIAPALHFGRVRTREISKAKEEIEFPSGDEVELEVDVPWLQIQPDAISQSGGTVAVTLQRRSLKPGRLQLQGGGLQRWIGWHTTRFVPSERAYHSDLAVQYANGQMESYPISVTVVPPTWRVAAGWLLTVVVMLAEVGVPVFIILALLAGGL